MKEKKCLKVILTMLIACLMFTLASCGGSDGGGTGETTAGEDPKPTGTYFQDGVLETDNFIAKIVETTVCDPETEWDMEDPTIVITYEFTNKSEEKLMPDVEWISCVEADQDSADTTLEVGMIFADKWQELNDNSSAEVKPGKTVKCIAVYNLVDKESPVTLTATDGMLGDELGTYKINLK